MHKTKPSSVPGRRFRLRLSPYAVLPLGLGAAGLLAAPLYGNVMESLLWMGETVKAMCGF